MTAQTLYVVEDEVSGKLLMQIASTKSKTAVVWCDPDSGEIGSPLVFFAFGPARDARDAIQHIYDALHTANIRLHVREYIFVPHSPAEHH